MPASTSGMKVSAGTGGNGDQARWSSIGTSSQWDPSGHPQLAAQERPRQVVVDVVLVRVAQQPEDGGEADEEEDRHHGVLVRDEPRAQRGPRPAIHRQMVLSGAAQRGR